LSVEHRPRQIANVTTIDVEQRRRVIGTVFSGIVFIARRTSFDENGRVRSFVYPGEMTSDPARPT